MRQPIASDTKVQHIKFYVGVTMRAPGHPTRTDAVPSLAASDEYTIWELSDCDSFYILDNKTRDVIIVSRANVPYWRPMKPAPAVTQAPVEPLETTLAKMEKPKRSR